MTAVNVERFRQHELATYPELQLIVSPKLIQLESDRREFVQTLVQNGLMTRKFANSGILKSFKIDHNLGVDALTHTLVGDRFGGMHHLPTAIALEVSGRMAASELGTHKVQKLQSIHSPGGQYRPNIVLTEEDGSIKMGGSSMFPNDWNAERIVRSIIKVAHTAPATIREKEGIAIHIATVDGVKIEVATDNRDGKIIGGRPKIENHTKLAVSH